MYILELDLILDDFRPFGQFWTTTPLLNTAQQLRNCFPWLELQHLTTRGKNFRSLLRCLGQHVVVVAVFNEQISSFAVRRPPSIHSSQVRKHSLTRFLPRKNVVPQLQTTENSSRVFVLC